MSEKPKIIFDNETEPKRMSFAELVPGKTYVAGEQIHIRMGEQDDKKRSSRQDIAGMAIHPGVEFFVHPESNSLNTYKRIVFKNGPDLFLADGCFPKEKVLVFEKNTSEEGYN